MRSTARLLAAAALLLLGAGVARGQEPQQPAQENLRSQLRESQSRLEQIRRERADLQQQMELLRSRVHDVSGELVNIQRQVNVSANALHEIDFQQNTLSANVKATSRQLLLTRDRLVERNVVLRKRLRSIYERGPLSDVRVLLSAESFGDLLNRYKYLQLITVYDRLLVNEVKKLESDLLTQDRELSQNLDQLERLKTQKLEEFTQLQVLQDQQRRTLSQVQGEVRRFEVPNLHALQFVCERALDTGQTHYPPYAGIPLGRP